VSNVAQVVWSSGTRNSSWTGASIEVSVSQGSQFSQRLRFDGSPSTLRALLIYLLTYFGRSSLVNIVSKSVFSSVLSEALS